VLSNAKGSRGTSALQNSRSLLCSVCRYAVAIVRAADEIGLPLCITVAVAEQPPLTQVLAVEQVHTGKRLGVWPSPSGETLPIGLLGTSMHMDEIDPIICKTFNGTGWEEDPSNGPHGERSAQGPLLSACACHCSHKSACIQSTHMAGPRAETMAHCSARVQEALGRMTLLRKN